MNFEQLLSICILTAGFISEVVSGMNNRHNSNIINGTPTTIEDHPYQVKVYNPKNVCGGSILNSNTIVTAAHCVRGANPDSIDVLVGTTNSEQGGIHFNVSKAFVHSNYTKIYGKNNNSYSYNDIAILKLEKNLEFSDKVKSINIQPKGEPVPAGTIATSTGWGVTNGDADRDILQKVEVTIMSNEKCNQIFDDSPFEITFLCAFSPGEGICYGDSGGPLVVNNTLIGIASFTISECADLYYPTMYTNVSYFNDFITTYL